MFKYNFVKVIEADLTPEEARTIPAFANMPENVSSIKIDGIQEKIAGRFYNVSYMLQKPYEAEDEVIDEE